MYGTMDYFMGYKIIVTDALCEYTQKRKHKKRRINKKWLKRYGKKLTPCKDLVFASPLGEKMLLCHPKYWDRYQERLINLVNQRSISKDDLSFIKGNFER